MKNESALKIAEELMGRLVGLERVEVKGSILRWKEDVKDIELLAIPDMQRVPLPRPEFGKPVRVYKTILDRCIAELVDEGVIRLEKNGEKFKKLFWMRPYIAVDLFLVTPPATWGVQALIRTGPADFSHWCVTRRKNGGALPNGFRVQDGAVWEGERENEPGEMVGFEDERAFLDFLGLGWVEPSQRVARWTR